MARRQRKQKRRSSCRSPPCGLASVGVFTARMTRWDGISVFYLHSGVTKVFRHYSKLPHDQPPTSATVHSM